MNSLYGEQNNDHERDIRMSTENHFNIDDPKGGMPRELAPGITTHIFPGDHAMLSVVQIEPGAEGTLHDHPEEQWGLCIAGSGRRTQGDEQFDIKQGDFWRTPGGTPHTIVAGADGLRILDIFAPPRAAYRKAGSGFGLEGE